MAKFNIPNIKHIDAKVLGKMFADAKAAIEGWDLDTGWVVVQPTYRHRLKVTPSFIQIQASDDRRGSDYTIITPTSVNSTEIVFVTAKAYMRILAET